jgi:hypothetical protein
MGASGRVCERYGCANIVEVPATGGRPARFCSSVCRSAWHRDHKRAAAGQPLDLKGPADHLKEALAASSRAAAALTALVQTYDTDAVEALRVEVELLTVERDRAVQHAASLTQQLAAVTGEAEALRSAVAAERELRE